VAALALGIGVSTTASTVAYGGLLRPLPLPDDSRLITLDKVFGPTGLTEGIKLNEFDAWRDSLASTATLSAFAGERVTIRSGGGAQDARAAYVIGNWFQVLGAQPLAGRLIDDAGEVGEAVVSRAFAERQGAGTPAVTSRCV
jgi:putative ABC transport system permease protein